MPPDIFSGDQRLSDLENRVSSLETTLRLLQARMKRLTAAEVSLSNRLSALGAYRPTSPEPKGPIVSLEV